MRVILIILYLTSISLSSMAQDTTNANKAVVLIKEYYNKSDYKLLYNLMAEDAKKQMSEEAVEQFFGKTLKAQIGGIKSYEFDTINNGNFIYNVAFDILNIELTLRLDAENKIVAWLWKPAKPKAKKTGTNAKMIKSNNPLQTQTQIYLDSLAKAYLNDERNCGLSIGYIKDGKMETYYYGETKKEKGQMPDENSLYEIGSISKTFTGVLLANTVNKGKINLDDDIRKYLPNGYENLQYKDTPIRIKDLSNHTSRLPRIPKDLDKQPGYDMNNPYKNYTKEMMYDYLKTVQLDTFPGTVFDYSNYGVALLGKILEDVNKKSLEKLLKEIITLKCKMPHTKFNLSAEEKQNECTGYMEDGKEASYWDLGNLAAAGGMKSNLPDMLNYLKANLEETNADIKLSHQQTSYTILQPMALGWTLSKTKDDKVLIWHNGGTSGFRTFCGFVNEKKVGVVVLSNSGNDVDDIAGNLIAYLIANK